MIELYLRNHWAKAVIVLALGATSWYIFYIYQQIYAPLFMTEPLTVVTSSQYDIPQTQIDSALEAITAKSTVTIDFSSVTTSVTPLVAATELPDNDEFGTEGITVNESAP